jgi:crotonobetainyl-CoA:carnitine CoA-transferase CaiB-like acyl-CoA transferase
VRCATSASRSCSTAAAPFYKCYETSDGKYVAVGAIEPQFFAALLRGFDLAPEEVPGQLDIGSYQRMYDTLAKRFATPTRDADACVTPVLTWNEAAADDHLNARSTVITARAAARGKRAARRNRLVSRDLRRTHPRMGRWGYFVNSGRKSITGICR